MKHSTAIIGILLPAMLMGHTSVMEARVESASPSLQRRHAMPQISLSVAQRLQKRLEEREGMVFSLQSVAQALADRKTMTASALSVDFYEQGFQKSDLKPAHLSPETLREWTSWVVRDGRLSFEIDEQTIRFTLLDHPELLVPKASHATALYEDAERHRLRFLGEPQDGYTFDVQRAAAQIAQAIRSGSPSLHLKVVREPAQLFLQEPDGMKQYALLGSGRSEFSHSPAGRKANIYKALEQYIDGTVLEPGSVFSFNDVVQDPNWSYSLIIVNGKDLVSAPGGGVCQAATTLFRAVLSAGLPVLKRANHSLYVRYYEQYGVGIDATVFPGKQDFTFQNDTGDRVFIHAKVEGDDAKVYLFGKPDGRSVTLRGPYFSQSKHLPTSLQDRPLRRNEIAWDYSVRYASGLQRIEPVISRYLSIPKDVAKTFMDTNVSEE